MGFGSGLMASQIVCISQRREFKAQGRNFLVFGGHEGTKSERQIANAIQLFSLRFLVVGGGMGQLLC